MEIRDAAAILKNAHLDASKKTVWADLGCGSGTFTMALASFLFPGSLIYDRQQRCFPAADPCALPRGRHSKI